MLNQKTLITGKLLFLVVVDSMYTFQSILSVLFINVLSPVYTQTKAALPKCARVRECTNMRRLVQTILKSIYYAIRGNGKR